VKRRAKSEVKGRGRREGGEETLEVQHFGDLEKLRTLENRHLPNPPHPCAATL